MTPFKTFCKRFRFKRTKMHHKCAALTILICLAMLLWWTKTRSKNSTPEEIPLISAEDILRDRMVLRRNLIRQKACTPVGNSSSARADLDFRSFVRPKFLPNFKNPCFVQIVAHGNDERKTTQTFGCLPYFIVAGFPKAGTTDMWTRFMNHPDVVINHAKEPMFFNKGKIDGSFKSAANKYIKFYARTADVIERSVCPIECKDSFPYHHSITGEASVDTAYDNRGWQQLPGNEGCTEPVVTNADYVHHLNPNVKVIFLLRNPIERLFSDYIYESRFYGYAISVEDFHQSALAAIQTFTECVSKNTLRACLYNNSTDSKKIRLRIGIYHVFLEDWLGVIHPSNVLVIRSEDTLGDRKLNVYRRVFSFLNIRQFTRQEEARVFLRGPINTRSLPEKDIGDMRPETRQVLQQFYRPFNEQLKLLLPGIDYNQATG